MARSEDHTNSTAPIVRLRKNKPTEIEDPNKVKFKLPGVGRTKDPIDVVRGLILAEADIILVTDRHLRDRLLNAKVAKTTKPVSVVLVDSFSDLKALDSAAMNEAGWFRGKPDAE